MNNNRLSRQELKSSRAVIESEEVLGTFEESITKELLRD